MSATIEDAGAGVGLASLDVHTSARSPVLLRTMCSMILWARTDFIGRLRCGQVSFQYFLTTHKRPPGLYSGPSQDASNEL